VNTLQMAEQLKYLLANDNWPDSPSDNTFGSVQVTDGPTEKALKELRMPIVLVTVGDTSEVDEEDPDLILQDFPLILVQAVLGDPMGERILIGGPRKSLGSSDGRGILELEARLLDVVGKATGADGARAACAFVGSPPSQQVEGRMIGSRKYNLKAWCTRDEHFDPPVHLVAEPIGSGNVRLSWTVPPDRYDRLKIVLRRATGLVAPATVATGTDVALASDLAFGVTDSPGVGTFSYSVWCGYTQIGAATSEKYSSLELGSKRTVIAT